MTSSDDTTKTIHHTFGMYFRNVYSSVLLMFCSVLVLAAICTAKTRMAEDAHPAVALLVLLIAIYWLSIVEGGQASLSGLNSIEPEQYKESHPTTYRIVTAVNMGNNFERYLVGRQLLVLALVFIANICAEPIRNNAKVLGLPTVFTHIFWTTGLAVFLVTTMVAMIPAKVNASRCMLDYVNSGLSLFTMHTSFLIEKSGLLHCCYLVPMLGSLVSGKLMEQKEPRLTAAQQLFFWFRVLVSLTILAFSLAVTGKALWEHNTTMWEGVHPAASLVLLFALMAISGLLEGMQTALFAVARMGDAERNRSFWAKKIWDVLVKEDGRNLPSFMIGRQMAVSMCFFVAARVTTVSLQNSDGNIFGVSNPLQEFFNTGLLGAWIVSVAGSITWQLMATAFPMAFLSSPFAYVLMRCCLLLNMTGLCQGAWLVSRFQLMITGFRLDEEYLGDSAEDDHQIKLGQPGKENSLSVYYPKLVYQLPLSEWFRFVRIWGAKLVLDVFGAAGAIWGFAEVVTLRTPKTKEFWRINASIVGVVFFLRYLFLSWEYLCKREVECAKIAERLKLQAKKYPLEVEDGRNESDQYDNDMSLTKETRVSVYYPSNVYHLPLIEWVRFVQMFGAKLVLEVFGAAGAIWGFAEVVTLRIPETNEFWRTNASIVGVVFFLRYLSLSFEYLGAREVECAKIAEGLKGFEDGRNEIDQYANDMSITAGHPINETRISVYYTGNVYHLPSIEWVRFVQMFGAKLVLEVFGAAGAIWGFAEVVTLRTSETKKFWRMNANIVGAVFFARYLFLAWTYLCERSMAHASNHHLKLDVDEPLELEDSRPVPSLTNNMGELTRLMDGALILRKY